MAPKQFESSFDYLNNLSVQQLRDILRSELEENEVNVELIKKINSVLASKSENKDIDVDTAFEKLLNSSENSELLYSEVTNELASEERKYQKPRFHYLLKGGLVAAVFVSVFLCANIVAYAMGIDVWKAITIWTDDHFGFFKNESETEELYGSSINDPYADLRKILSELTATEGFVPNYIPPGFSVTSVNCIDSVEGTNIFCILTNREQSIVLSFIILSDEPLREYTKDVGDPEVYTVNGSEHYIFSNDGNYRAIWLNGDVECDFSGFVEKKELLKTIDSIYKG